MMSIIRAALSLFSFVIVSAMMGAGAQATQEKERFVTVEGAVNRAGRIGFPEYRGLSIVDAITLAGGHTGHADLKRVWLFRATPAGEAPRVVLNVHLIMRGDAKDVELSPGDRVVLIGRDVDDDGW